MLRAPNGDPLPRILDGTQAHEVGISAQTIRTELARERWQAFTRGLYLTSPERPRRSDWAVAGLRIAGPGSALSGWDALRARGLGADRPPIDEVLIIAERGTHRVVGKARVRPSTRPVTTVRLPLADAITAVPMVGAARAVADTALTYRTFRPVRALVTAAVQRRLCTPDELEAELEAGPQNGSAHLRDALEDVFGGVESISEAELADLVRAGRYPRVEYNVPILTWDGTHIATADALWRELRAGLEVNSKKYHFYEGTWYSTMQRHNALTRRGLSLTHYAPREIRSEPARVGNEVEEWLRMRATELGLPYLIDDTVHPRPRLHVPFVLPRPSR